MLLKLYICSMMNRGMDGHIYLVNERVHRYADVDTILGGRLIMSEKPVLPTELGQLVIRRRRVTFGVALKFITR